MESITPSSTATTTINDDDHNDNACTQCKHKLAQQAKTIEQLRNELKAKDEAFERLQQDIHTLNKKYVAQIERVADVQHEKALVEHELEELSTRLFEEANGMVAEEKRQRYLLEQELQQTQEHLMAEQSQLQELRERIVQLPQQDDDNNNSYRHGGDGMTNKDPNMARARHDLQQLYNCKRASANNHHMYYNKMKRAGSSSSSGAGCRGEQQQQQRTASMPPLPSTMQQQQQQQKKQQMSIDQIQLEAFQEFVRASPNTPFKKLNQFIYMKVCQQEDVEPCLRFGPHSRLSVKKMNEFLSRQPCFIEQLDEQSQKTMTINTNVPSAVMARPLWERFSSSSNNNNNKNNNQNQHHQQCSACGRRPAEDQQGALSYRFRLDEMDDWAAIDQYCRDRLVAVCEFYVFIRNVQKGFYADRNIDDLYTENIRLRLQMFYSRMGALPVVLDGIGLDPGAVGKASPPLDTIPDDGDDDDDDDASDYASMSSGPHTPIQQMPPIVKEKYDEDAHHHVDNNVANDKLENNHHPQHHSNNNSNNDNVKDSADDA